MDELLVPVSTTTTHSKHDHHDQLHVVKAHEQQSTVSKILSVTEALDILRSRPTQEALRQVLWWVSGVRSGLNFNSQDPQASQIIHALVNDVLPDHWRSIREEKAGDGRKTRDVIISILSNVGGISTITNCVQFAVTFKDRPVEVSQIKLSSRAALLEDLLSLLESVLEPDNILLSIWQALATSCPHSTRRWLLWKELVALLGNGRVLSIASQADDIATQESSTMRKRSWLSDGSKYSSWLGRNLSRLIVDGQNNDSEVRKAWAHILERAMTLGHAGEGALLLCLFQAKILAEQLIETTFHSIIQGSSPAVERYCSYTAVLRGSSKKAVVSSLLLSLAKVHLPTPHEAACDQEISRSIGGIAALVHALAKYDRAITDVLVEWLSGDGLLQDLRIRRAVVAALAEPMG